MSHLYGENQRLCTSCFEIFLPCNHFFCLSCIRQVAYMHIVSSQSYENPFEQNHLSRRGRYLHWSRSDLLTKEFNCPYCRGAVALGQLSSATCEIKSTITLNSKEIISIWGEAYYQGVGSFGIASYHFEEDGQAYISYEKAHWKLDDGQPPPNKKYFETARYDEDSRTYYGTIDWRPTLFGESALWQYEIRFSPDFLIVEGGGVKSYDINNEMNNEHKFNEPGGLMYENSRPALSSIFGNVYHELQEEKRAPYHFEDPENCYISYADVGRTLDDGSRFPLKKYFKDPEFNPENKSFTGIIEWELPGTCMGDSKWEYEMIFTEDCSYIVSGQVLRYNSEGERSGPPLTYGLQMWNQLRYVHKKHIDFVLN